jgi:hypothetical protein
VSRGLEKYLFSISVFLASSLAPLLYHSSNAYLTSMNPESTWQILISFSKPF